MQCPRCQVDSEGVSTCPACGADLSQEGSESRPAHLAILESHAAKNEVTAGPKPRLKSRAGPAIPVSSAPQTDTTPNSWMARLEAAKRIGVDVPSPAEPTPETQALPPALRADSTSEEDEEEKDWSQPLPDTLEPKPGRLKKPTHLLLAELDEEEMTDRGHAPTLPMDQSSIAQIRIDGPKVDVEPKRKIPMPVILGLAGLIVIGAISWAVMTAKQAPPVPEAQVNPELIAKKQRLEKAMTALEEGHVLIQQGKSKADAAIAQYQKALEFEPTLAKAERGLGIAYASKGDKEEAVKHYERYLDLDPDASDAGKVRAIIGKYKRKMKKK